MSNADDISFFFFSQQPSGGGWWHILCHLGITVWVNMSQRFPEVWFGSRWRAWWDAMVRPSEVPFIRYGERTSALSAHLDKYFPFSFSLLKFFWIEIRSEVWVLSLQQINHFHWLLPTCSGPGRDHLPCLGKDQELHWEQARGGGRSHLVAAGSEKTISDVSPSPRHPGLPMQKELSEEWLLVKNPWADAALPLHNLVRSNDRGLARKSIRAVLGVCLDGLWSEN